VEPQPDAIAASRSMTVPILMYHYISVPPQKADRIRMDLSVTPANFDVEMAYLATHGYTSVSLYDVYNALATGALLPAKPVVITFDDGYRDVYVNAYPLLKKYHMTGTVFIISDPINSGNLAYLTWNMVKEMAQGGMSIESHSRTHPDMRNRSYEFLVYEILGPIEAITAYTGQTPHFFCYPSGRYDAAVIRVLKSAHTWAAVTTQAGDSRHALSDAMTWTRVRVHGTTTLQQFAELVKLPSQDAR
jgi:peptidoglycan/xylan/chitin deacetylase (PgdA/CDA1 family)